MNLGANAGRETRASKHSRAQIALQFGWIEAILGTGMKFNRGRLSFEIKVDYNTRLDRNLTFHMPVLITAG